MRLPYQWLKKYTKYAKLIVLRLTLTSNFYIIY